MAGLYAPNGALNIAVVAADSDPVGIYAPSGAYNALVSGLWVPLASSGVQVSHTGTTSETALATATIPGGALGPNGILRVTAIVSCTNSADDKTIRFRLGGISGSAFLGSVLTTSASYIVQRTIWNRNAENAQVSWALNVGSFANTTAAIVTAAQDTSVDKDFVISGQLENAADTVSLEAYLIELLYGL